MALNWGATYINTRTIRCVNGALEKIENFLFDMQTNCYALIYAVNCACIYISRTQALTVDHNLISYKFNKRAGSHSRAV